MSTSVSSVTNHFPSAENGFGTTTTSSITSGDTTVYLASLDGYDNGEVVVFIVDPADSAKKQTFTGVVNTAGLSITSVVWTAGTNQNHALGATVVDYATATHISMISKGLAVAHNQNGTHKTSMVLVTPKVDTIGENTPANGVTIDGLNIKDGKLNTNDSVVTANITAAAVTPPKWTNPYKFRAYDTAGGTSGTAGFTKKTFNTESFDTNSNFASSTYTVPVSGFYMFGGAVLYLSSAVSNIRIASIYKNGAEAIRGTEMSSPSTMNFTVTVSGLLQLTAGDTIELWQYSLVSVTFGNGGQCNFWGYLVSET